MVTKWRSVWFQTEKVKSTKTLYENEIRKKIRATFLTDFCLRRPRYLLRSFSSVFVRVFMVPAGNGELLLCWQPFLSKGKAVRKMRNKTRKSLLSFPWLRRYFDEGERAADLISRLLTKTRKETKTSMLQHKKKDPDPLVCSCIAQQFSIEFDELSGSRLR